MQDAGASQDRSGEYLSALQAQLDRLTDRNSALSDRVRKLESDRALLRERLARAQRRWYRPMRNVQMETRPPLSENSIHVPGVGAIPDVTLPIPAPKRDLVVATVLDEFSRAAFGPEMKCIDIPVYGLDQLEESVPDLLFVESAFSGIDGSWSTRIARFGAPHPALKELVDWCRSRGIPTVFWNKEDPINYDWFISSASLFDHVFTVDSDMIDRYVRDLSHSRVAVLPFAAQPTIHHPPENDDVRTGSVAFAGSYYVAKHPKRREQMEMLLGPATEFGLHIFDRFAGTKDERFAWPARYRSAIMGGLTYAQTLEAYRRYRVFLNVNTVTTSPTMCARRVFELLASGTAIVTADARAIRELIPPEIVSIVSSANECRTTLELLLNDGGGERGRQAMAWIHAGHTVSHRVDEVIRQVL
ncbi:MAG: glycosyltransferase [Acidimicrobiia bacterium]|nr:glycosyltransferase [Acidimicrobiia bacterium]MDH4307720.1 glycosyltransferase [Acidimicrobiia bacterium]